MISSILKGRGREGKDAGIDANEDCVISFKVLLNLQLCFWPMSIAGGAKMKYR